MKQNILYLFFVVGLLSFVAISCSKKEEVPADDSFALILQTSVSSPATKAEVPSVTSLKEDAVELLNVYFYGTFSGNVSPTLKHYSLSSATDKTGATSWKVSSDWRADGFIAGNSYDVYVSANSKQVKTAATSNDKLVATGTLASASITDLAGLKSMIEFDYNPAEANGEGGHKPYWGAYDEDNLNPEWLDLHKKFIPDATFDVSTGNSQQKRYYANEKTFLMDGKTTFTAGSTEAIPLELVRAAAKVVVDVKFGDAFLSSLAAKNVTVSGAPAWRFYNFSFSTPVIDPSLITGAAVNYNKSIFVAGGIMMGKSPEDSDLVYDTGADKHFSFVTYTYPLSWTAGSASSEAPAIILSLGYTDSTDPLNPVTTYQTYKIPVVDPEGGVLEIGRNKLYRVQATIASEGGELLTDAYKVRCNYDIIPWGDIPVNSEDIADVDHSDNDYFDVSPTSVTLRGDGMQSETITIIKPNKRNIKMKYITLPNATAEDPFNTTGVSASDYHEYSFAGDVAENSPAPYFFNYLGDKQNHLVSEKTVGSVVAGTTTYLQNKFTRSDRALTIESCSLPNLADKYMMIRVYLDVTDWESKGFYRDITIRHLSTTRISHVIGAWSSRISACSALDPSDPNYEAFNSTSTGPYGPEEYRYTGGSYVLNSDQVPTSTSSQPFRNYRWVNYAKDTGSSVDHYFRLCSDGYTTNNRGFRPKYYNGTNVYYMSANNTTRGQRVTQGTVISGFNPRIFIVQSSAPSSSYVMGRPIIDEDGLSQDRVLSPAFMIASQLGAVSAVPSYYTKTIPANVYGIQYVASNNERKYWSAKHCATYMEVGEDGTYYKNWRLPTQEEIGVIIGLQSASPDNDTSLNNVLSADLYYALDGTQVRAKSGTGTSLSVRCVRDLTQAEIDALNN